MATRWSSRLAAARLLLAVLAFLVAPPVQSACDAVSEITTAGRTVVHPDGRREATLVGLPDRLPGRTERHHTSYLLPVRACADGALWLFRVGAVYAVRDQDGRPLPLLGAGGSPRGGGRAAYNGRIPALFALPPGTREVRVQLLSPPYLTAGLLAARVGPTNLLLPQQARALDQVVHHADAGSGIMLVLGALALLLWSQRRTDRTLLWLAVACGLWGVRGVAYYGPYAVLPPLAFEHFNALNVLLASAALSASVLSLLRALTPRLAQALGGASAACVVVLLVSAAAGQGALLARWLCFATGFAMVAVLPFVAWRRRARLPPGHGALLAGLVGALLACAVHDLLVAGGVLAPTRPSTLFWGFVAMLVGFAAMTGQYVVRTLNRAERSNQELERHVARKTLELEQSYALLRESERDAARTQERERLLRDMHDGLGAQLMTALRGLERGAAGPPQIAQALQDSLDELRLLMDSTEMGQYLPGALAAWRNRWDARLAAAGVQLHWHIDESLDSVQLPGDAALQLLRILQESAANVVKHAQAREMALHARVDAVGALHIAILDDGCGLPVDGPRAGARGLKNMQHRAAQLGAQLMVRSRPDARGTEVVLRLPLAAQPTSPRRAASIAASARDEMPSLR